MAQRRMFAKTIIDSDAFLDLPLSSQALYFHLSMRADDDGFINNPKKIQRMTGASDDDLKLLIAKKFLIPFESGIVVIKHWKIHNYIQKDRYRETVYKEEKRQLEVKDNNAYTLLDTECIHDGYSLETQVRLGKDRDRVRDRLKEEEEDARVRELPIDENMAEVMQEFERCGFATNAYLADEVQDMLSRCPTSWIVEGIRRATEYGGKSLAYIKSILSEFEKAGCITDPEKDRKAKPPSRAAPDDSIDWGEIPEGFLKGEDDGV